MPVTLEDIHDKLTNLEVSIDEVKTGIDRCNDRIELFENGISPRVQSVEHDVKNIKSEIDMLKDKNAKLENYLRRDNLIFGEITEEQTENCSEKVKCFIQDHLGLSADQIKFVRVHRLGQPREGKTRPIMARFHYFGDRQDVWKTRDKIYGTDFWIAEDFAPEIQEKRRILKPILKHAIDKKLCEKAYLVADKLIIDGTTYTINDLENLPTELNPAKIATPTIGDQVVAFHNGYSPFSNFYNAKFTLEGIEYQHVEQYFWSKKAEFARNPQLRKEILREPSPFKCKSLGKQLGRLKDWNQIQENTMLTGCSAKFNQNPSLMKFLKDTGDRKIIEARKDDKFWGAGLDIKSKDLLSNKLPGKNVLGNILMKIRAKEI
jgi:ribA/ribD-fused uncharacterized protein